MFVAEFGVCICLSIWHSLRNNQEKTQSKSSNRVST